MMGQKMRFQLSMSRNGKEVSIPMCETSTNIGRFVCIVGFLFGLLYGTIYYCPLIINYKTLWEYSYFVLIYSLIFILAASISVIISDMNTFIDKQLKLKQRLLWHQQQQQQLDVCNGTDLNELRIAGVAAQNDIYDDTAAAVHSICGGGGVVDDDAAAQPKKRRFSSLKEE
jgi:hypothetical protein